MFSAAGLSPLDLVCSDKWNICVSYVFKFLLLHCDTVFTAKSLRTRLQKETFSLSLPDRLRSQHSSDSLIKHLRGERADCEDTGGEDSPTCLRPLWVRAEHSRYLTDRILFASFCPCSLLMGEWPLSARACRASLSSLRSILVPENKKIFFFSETFFCVQLLPINKMGASGQWCLISGHHFEVTFSKDDGLTTEKQMRKTSVCG